MAVRKRGESPLVVNNNLTKTPFTWALRPKSEELSVEELELGVFAESQFPKLD